MMKLINKQYTVFEIEAYQISSHLSDYIYNGLEITEPLKYIKGLVLNGNVDVDSENGRIYTMNVCSGVEMMTQEEKDVVDLGIENQRLNNEVFKGYKYRVTSKPEIIYATSPLFSLTIVGLIDKNEAICNYNEVTGMLESIYSYWDNINAPFLYTINENPGVFKLETNPLIA